MHANAGQRRLNIGKYKIGIIGFGKIAHDQHAPAIAASDQFELVAVSNVGSMSPPPGIPSFATPAEILQNVPDLDALALCTPPGPRRLIAAQCLSARKHVLLEKPPAATVAEVDDLANRAKAAGKVVFATYHAQHNAAVDKAAELLAGQSIKTLAVTWKEDIRQWHPGQDWILDAGGLGIFDPGINALSILTRILPQPVFIHSANLSIPNNRQAPIAADILFSTGTGAAEQLSATLDWRQSGPPTWEIMIQTVGGAQLKLSDGGSRLEVEGQSPFVGPADEYPDIYRTFAALLANGQSNVDRAPFQLVADAFMVGRRIETEAFSF
ncbi:MAG TPA: Gfo/Idh/MocA family oxidoreductase [Sphingomicrobium sp.]|nr:Gfo/Idh/MocA family oxidoreductase [Sphingomicrobium sp.]